MSHSAPSLTRIISGGQTGVDRAALDMALARGIPCGGWCPQGRRAEDGTIPARYPLTETPTADYPQRTEWNVRDADATLVLTHGEPAGGTALTADLAHRLGKPLLVVDLAADLDPDAVRSWLVKERVRVLNVAGPRESTFPGVYALARAFLQRLLDINQA
jgi:predicted Rossmann fold nucleotide-binding protein DprA/Smf involved in DNA uptake